VISQGGQMRRGADQHARFNHATDHRFQSGLSRRQQRFMRAGDAARFHELHVHPVKTL